MSSLTFKDFIPLTGTVLTVIMGYRLISVQINKNRKAKWIDDFRKEVANFYPIVMAANKNFTTEDRYKLVASVGTLSLYLLGSNQPDKKELFNRLLELQDLVIDNAGCHDPIMATHVGVKMGEILVVVTRVIEIEQKKI